MILAITSGLCVFIHSSLNKKMHSFHKRFFVLSLCIILAFTTISKPREVKAFAITLATVTGIVAVASGIVVASHELYTWWQETHPEDSEDDCLEYFKNNISIDGNGNYVLTDDAKLTINNMMDKYENNVTYQNMFLPAAVQIDASTFNTKLAYSKFYTLVESNSGQIFSISSASHNYNNYHNISGWTIRVYDADVCGVSSEITSGMGIFPVNVFNSEWQSGFTWIEFYLCDTESNNKLVYKNSSDEWMEIDNVEDVKSFDMSLAMNRYTGGAKTKFASTRALWNSSVVTNNQIFTNFNGAFPVFKNIVDLKNGTSLGAEGRYMPDYTGQPITNNIVDSHDVTNAQQYITNNYGGGGGGGGDNDDSDSGLTGFLGAIGKLGEAILKILNTLIGIIADAVKVVTGGFTAVTDLIQNGFSDFLASLFPYIPKEWVACITLSLTLMVFGVVIKLFTK